MTEVEQKESTTTTTKEQKPEKTDQNDSFNLKVKAEFILKERAASLPAIKKDTEKDQRQEQQEQQQQKDDRGGGDRGSGKKKRGMNRKRPHSKVDQGSKLCQSVVRGDKCPFGDNCRFSHDLKEFMATRPPDIIEVEGGCPHFKLYGHCRFGPSCRLGGSHLNKAGENITADPKPTTIPPPVVNQMPKKLQDLLRKKKYPFKCKLHYEEKGKNGKKNGKGVEEEKTEVVIDEKKEDATDKKVVKEESIEKPAEKKEEDVTMKEGGIEKVATPEASETTTDVDKTIKQGTQDGDQKNDSKKEDKEGRVKPLDLSPLPDKEVKLIDFSKKVYIAPLTTVGNLPFRRVMKRLGADITCGEMAVATNILQGHAPEWALLKRHPDEDIFGIQIAAGFYDQATRCSELLGGYVSADFVDLNVGCPLDLICDKGCGSSLMLRDKRLEQAVRGMAQTLSCPVTIKMRTGWDMTKPFAHKLMSKIQSWDFGDKIAAVMIHGRSRTQRYSNSADWDYIHQVAKAGAASAKEHGKRVIPVIGNGDLFSYTDYESKVLASRDENGESEGGLSTCAMLARGALIKPWLPTEIKERRHWDISASERLDILKDFVRFGLEHWGSDQQGVNSTRRFLLEWLSFLHRYVPVGLIETLPQQMNQRLPTYMCGRNDLETLFLSENSVDWVKISEMLLGPVEEGFRFEAKHKAKSIQAEG